MILSEKLELSGAILFKMICHRSIYNYGGVIKSPEARTYGVSITPTKSVPLYV